MACSFMCLVFFGVVAYGLYYAFNYFKKWKLEKTLERWKNTPKNLVVLHGLPPAITLPNASPFVLKVETFFKWAKIKYHIDTTDPWGPKAKTPWITINGKHIGDSHFILEFLKKKFPDKIPQTNHSKEQLATAALVRIVLEEHFFWGLALERTGSPHTRQVINFPYFEIIKHWIRFVIRRRSKSQGIGLHTDEEITELMKNDLRYVSSILGNKKYIAGDQMCEDDCAIFGMLAQVVWGLPNSPYEALIKELPNIKEYCLRIKNEIWKDWDSCLA